MTLLRNLRVRGSWLVCLGAERRRNGCVGGTCAVCGLSQRMHGEVSMARWGKKATWRGKHISAERSGGDYRMHRAEEGV